ncbi:MAG: RHS repeat-associated core domain-containing protein [Methylocella sp.]
MTQREYIWLVDLPVAVVDQVATAPVIYYVHTDHVQRPVAMTNASQNIAWSATYTPFGAVQTIATPSTTLDLRFPGQWFPLETRLHYNWHRHYDPSTGRYLQPDPLGCRWTGY